LYERICFRKISSLLPNLIIISINFTSNSTFKNNHLLAFRDKIVSYRETSYSRSHNHHIIGDRLPQQLGVTSPSVVSEPIL
jgi:hypothetical protein